MAFALVIHVECNPFSLAYILCSIHRISWYGIHRGQNIYNSIKLIEITICHTLANANA